MMENGIGGLLVFGAVSLLVVVLGALYSRGNRRTRNRLRNVGGTPTQSLTWLDLRQKLVAGLPSLGNPLLPKQEKDRQQLSLRMQRASLHHPQAPLMLLGVKVFLMLLGPLVGLIALALDQSIAVALAAALVASGAGLVLPGVWLDGMVRRRQTLLRRGLADALDMLVLCLEGGLSLHGALQRLRGELQTVHPELTAELTVVEREMMMGVPAGEALRKLGERADLEELRSLASVLQQSERYGASMVKAMRVYSDTMRNERQQRSEELAQKAAVKILFPTLLCIFPAIFVVILGPAAVQIRAVFAQMK